MRARILWRSIATLTVIASLFAIGAQPASAAVATSSCPGYALAATAGLSYYPSSCPVRTKSFVPANYDFNYAYVYGRADCPVGVQCFAAGEPTILAWRWSGSAWLRSSFNRDERVWVRKFGSGWSWAWTARTGYLAIQTSRLYTWTYSPTTPVVCGATGGIACLGRY